MWAAEPPLRDALLSTWPEESFTLKLTQESVRILGGSHEKPTEIISSNREFRRKSEVRDSQN